MVGVVLAATPWLVDGYRALCAGPVDTYPKPVAARDEARDASATPVAGTPAPLADPRGAAFTLLLQVKQSDSVAFPAHAVVGTLLEWGGCPVEATSDQWRKAAGHAWLDSAARLAADGLARTAGAAFGDRSTLDWLARYAADEPWHAENLGRVQAAYRPRRP